MSFSGSTMTRITAALVIATIVVVGLLIATHGEASTTMLHDLGTHVGPYAG